MSKSSVVRGTPVNHMRAGSAGVAPGKPGGFDGTQPQGFGSEKGGYRPDPRGGTAYNSDRGNPGDARRVEQHDRYGRVIDSAPGDQANPAANGSGVVLDGVTRENGYMANSQPYPDGPVPKDAPWFETRSIRQENEAHTGSGFEDNAEDDLGKIGGVMTRDDCTRRETGFAARRLDVANISAHISLHGTNAQAASGFVPGP